ncbi:hypothetical protein P8605_28470, partial [Streptomyces sp. T-3]|nr:hypothetical protein [Streptomyces sp. T-3]
MTVPVAEAVDGRAVGEAGFVGVTVFDAVGLGLFDGFAEGEGLALFDADGDADDGTTETGAPVVRSGRARSGFVSREKRPLAKAVTATTATAAPAT